jgi:hypothetical protein
MYVIVSLGYTGLLSIVRDGAYVENIVVNKRLTVKSENGFVN